MPHNPIYRIIVLGIVLLAWSAFVAWDPTMGKPGENFKQRYPRCIPSGILLGIGSSLMQNPSQNFIIWLLYILFFILSYMAPGLILRFYEKYNGSQSA